MESPAFLETVGKQLSILKELDISYGKIPADSYKKIGDNFLHLEVLRIKQHSEEFRTITRKHAIQLLVCLLKLKILDDDSTAWSCVLPALTQLSKEMYSHFYATVEHLTIYQCSEYAPNIKKLEILNQVILDVSTNNQHIAADDDGRLLARPYFRHLTHLSFTGAWTENIVCVLLNNCVFLRDLILKPNVLPVTFLKHNPLSYLQRLILDRSHLVWNECDLELNFLLCVLKSTSNSLSEIGLKSRPPMEWEGLLQQLKMENCDFQILRPIV
ncbi:hypothetical protein GHT06_012828 [Daphnia sinensis]|uniref:Uncharacterized protein n=1 Tax=Daphnia sinensis TaxID=1820382 RepID=A0AAD5LFM0_9CRUS|nr:hypothetical protein GHT06_012828 [Daphnia sinensis]